MSYKDFERRWASAISSTPKWVLLVFHPVLWLAYIVLIVLAIFHWLT